MKKSRFLLLWFILLLMLKGFGQDTLVYFDELHFESDFEKEVFDNFLHKESKNYLSMTMLTKTDVSAKEIQQITRRVENGYKTLNTEKFARKKETRQVKVLFKKVHDLFLHKYDTEAEFYEIFESGNYNCVTAAILYGMYLQKLNIPFVVNETPIHVYIIAYPETHRILL